MADETSSDTVLSIGETAERLGGVSRYLVRKWAQRGDLPAFRTLGGQWRFYATKVDAFRGRLEAGDFPEWDDARDRAPGGLAEFERHTNERA